MDTETTAYDYQRNMDQEEKAYSSRLDSWLFNTFLNTSSAPRNNRPWFNRCISQTFEDKFGGKTTLIGLTGLAGSGKDSALGYLYDHEKHGYYFDDKTNMTCHRTAFADPLKKIAKIVGFSDEQLSNRELKEKVDAFWGISPRQFLQMCGTEMFRKVWREDAWVKMTIYHVRDFMDIPRSFELPGQPPTTIGNTILLHNNTIDVYERFIFITDVRFPNEVEAIKAEGGYVFRIERPNNPLHISEKHDSEKFIETLPVDGVITNDASSSEEWGWKFAKDLTQHFNHRAFY